jgi:ATP-dependent exoDNAse
MKDSLVLTPSQKAAFAALNEFVKNEEDIFILRGSAGSGKTSIVGFWVQSIIDSGRPVELMVPTGRAVRMLQDRAHVEVRTIHSCIYVRVASNTLKKEVRNDNQEEFELPCEQFTLRQERKRLGTIHVVDEASMIGDLENNTEQLQFGSGRLLTDLLDYCQFTASHSKLVLVGDSFQLPPVGENTSPALSAERLQRLGYKVQEFTLEGVVRQSANSCILSNSLKIPLILGLPKDQRRSLRFDTCPDEVESCEPDEIVRRFCYLYHGGGLGNSVIIAYTNADVYEYNQSVREGLGYSNELTIGDLLIVGRASLYPGEQANSLSWQNDTLIHSGSFARVLVLGQQHVVDQGLKRGKEVVNVHLILREVSLFFLENGRKGKFWIIESLLYRSDIDLNRDEELALYLDFKKRNNNIKKEEEQAIIRRDALYHALHVKFGYAVTCHRAQGGEWEWVFVDYTGRNDLSDEALRWVYTATTRASKHLCGYLFPNISPISTIQWHPIQLVKREIKVCLTENPQETPFHQQIAPAFLKQKYWQVLQLLSGSRYSVEKVESRDYREIYQIKDLGGAIYRFDTTYDKAGRFSPFTSSSRLDRAFSSPILQLLNASEKNTPKAYQPHEESLQTLFVWVSGVAKKVSVPILEVREDLSRYQVVYRIKGSGLWAYIVFSINSRGRVSSAQPRSDLGMQDVELQRLLDSLQEENASC